MLAHARGHTYTHINTQGKKFAAWAARVAPVQLETVVHFGSRMICEPTAEGRAGQETFHHFVSRTPRPITSQPKKKENHLPIKCDRSQYSLVVSLFDGLFSVIDIVVILMR